MLGLRVLDHSTSLAPGLAAMAFDSFGNWLGVLHGYRDPLGGKGVSVDIVHEVLSLKRKHYECQDSWYSCPKSKGGCADEGTGDECDCGADEQNKRIDLIVAELRRMGIGEAAPAKTTEKTWRNDYETYLKDCEAGFDALYGDWDWISQQRIYYPGCAIQRSLDKMFQQFWGTPAGWKHKKSKKSTTDLDWKRTIENGLSMKGNRCYWGRDEVDTEAATLRAKGLIRG